MHCELPFQSITLNITSMDEEKKKVFFNNMIYPSTSHQPATPKAPCDEGTSSAGMKETELEPGQLLLALLESTGKREHAA